MYVKGKYAKAETGKPEQGKSCHKTSSFEYGHCLAYLRVVKQRIIMTTRKNQGTMSSVYDRMRNAQVKL